MRIHWNNRTYSRAHEAGLELKTPGFSVVVPALREEDDSAAEGATRLAGKEPEGRLIYSCRAKEKLRDSKGASQNDYGSRMLDT